MHARALLGMVAAALAIGGTPPAAAQQEPGQTAQSSVGQAGQRQTREQAVPSVAPMSRISSRIQNRVETRLSTRIDPNARAAETDLSPFAAAADETRTPVQPPR
jgi:hypothetical protein